MKICPLLFIISFAFAATDVKGQYVTSVTTTTYQNLTAPVSINNGAVWDETTTYPLNFGFNLELDGESFSSLLVQAGGGLTFNLSTLRMLAPYHIPFGGYILHDRGSSASSSPIGYEISGGAGQHVLKIEWENAGFTQWLDSNPNTDFVDFQIWMFEQDNHIEIHYGSNHTDAITYGNLTGANFIFYFDSCSNIMCITGPADAPQFGYYNLCGPMYYFIDGTPSNGITYNFYRTFSGVPDNNASSGFEMYPNPFTDFLTVSNKFHEPGSRLRIVDVTGAVMVDQDIGSGTETINVADLPKGVYFICLQNGVETRWQKAVK